MIYRLLIIILSINFLIINSVQAAGMGGGNTYKYYKTKNESPARCNTNHAAMCASMPNVFQASSGSCGEETKTCGQYMGTTLSTRQCTGQTPYGTYSYQDMYESALQFQEESLTCEAGHHMELQGCSATCVKDDDCGQKVGQSQSMSVQCGTVFCSAGVTSLSSGSTYTCTQGGVASFSRGSFGQAVKGQCVLAPPSPLPTITGEQTLAKIDQLGSSSVAVYCNVDFQYTGATADGSPDTPNQIGDLPFQVSYVPRNADGHCNAGYVPGERNGELICAPDPTSTSGGCPTGQIRNNSGVCENNSTAGQPNKTTKNNPDGSVTEEETTNNPDGSSVKTSTTTKNNPDGTTTKTTTTETTNAAGNKTSTTNSTTTPNTLPCSGGRPRNSQNLCPSGTGTTDGTCDPATTTCPESGDGGNTNGGGSASVSRPASIDNTITTSWWNSSYPNGLSGVWQSHQNELNNTPFVASLNQFKAGIPNSGSCPSFSLSLGAYDGSISPPCVIWPFLRAVFLFSTMMLCRRIVFGG